MAESALCACGNPRREGQRTCHECHSAAMREWRKHNPLTPEQRKKSNCHSYSRMALKRGIIQRQTCRYPGCVSKAQMHHPDYNEPLLVIWLCRHHHLLIHINRFCNREIEGQYAPLKFKRLTSEAHRLKKYTTVTRAGL